LDRLGRLPERKNGALRQAALAPVLSSIRAFEYTLGIVVV